MSIKLKLCIPNVFTPKVRVLPSQSVSIINNIHIFSPNNKMLFIAKGMILSYNKCMGEYNLTDGDFIFALKISQNNSFIERLLNTDEEINISQIRNSIPIFGPCYEVNLKSINKIIMMSLNQNSPLEMKSYQNKFTNIEIAKKQDIKLMRRENCRKNWRKQISSFLKQESPDFNCYEYTNIFYDAPKEPSCEALPMLL